MSRVKPEAADQAEAASTFETMVDKLQNYEPSDLPDRTKMALRLADAISMAPEMVDEEFYERLRAHFDDDQILDLGMVTAFFSGWQRFIEAFGIVPDRWQDGDTKPWLEQRGER